MKLIHFLILAVASFTTSTVLAVPPKTNTSAETIPPFNVKTDMTATSATSPSRLTTLDVVSIGMTVEMFRQSQAWMELQKHTTDSILPADLSAYPTNEKVKELATENRASNALEYGASHFVEYWPIPSVSVWSYYGEKEVVDKRFGGKTNYDYFNDRIDSLRMPAGMHTHKIASLGSFFSNEPEDALEHAFQFFERNPEVPALMLLMSDGDQMRAMTHDMSREPYWGEGPRRFDSMTESFVVLVLARRERVDALRPFAWHSQAHSGAEYEAERDRQAVQMKVAAKNPAFKPTTYLQFPWSDMQIQQFDALPTIAVLHRPVRVTYRKDKEGKPTFDSKLQDKLMPPQQRQAAFKTGFDEALKEVSGGKPARVFYDAGDAPANTNFVPLTLAVHNSLPDFDLFEPHEGYDIFRRIGNTGAASPFVQWALASMASFQKKDASITVNLRQKEEATITVITPSTDTRQHPMGHPFDFNLAPDDGSPAVPVAPPAPVKPPHASVVSPAPILAPAAPAAQPATIRTVTLGTLLSTGDECTQSGMWRCNPPDADAGATHYFSVGRTFPTVTVTRPLTTLQKMRGLPSSEKVTASWTLVSYDVPNA